MSSEKVNVEKITLPVCEYDAKTKNIQGNSSFDSIIRHKINLEFHNDFFIDFFQTINKYFDDPNSSYPIRIIEIDESQYIVFPLYFDPQNKRLCLLFLNVNMLNSVCKLLKPVHDIEEEYISIIESIHDDFVITDKNGTIINVLPNFESLYGVPADTVIGKTIYDLEEQRIFNPSIAAKVIDTKSPETLLQMTQSGKYLMCTAIPITDSEGNIVKIVSFSRDVTQYEQIKKEYAELEESMKFYASEVDRLKKAMPATPDFISESAEMKKIYSTIERVAPSDANVLFTGESGVGKTMYAKAIHEKSNRANKPFIEINCGAIPENLFESELFGYKKGAFTGANDTGKVGWIEKANGGTLFLDEIADMPMTVQVKLLKTLDSKMITPVGGTVEKRVDFRLVAATNKNIPDLIKENLFREDLFFRLNVMPIFIPPLRDRPDDIFHLLTHFLKKNQEKYSIKRSFSKKALDCLLNYQWPGNVRELENIVERLFLTSENYMITEDDLPENIYPNNIFPTLDPSCNTLHEILESVEKKLILDSYSKHHSTTKAAKELGISQPSVSIKLKKYLSE